ncbi:NADP-dependent 3-hydroxy acid dehydrogenase YdfG [Faunimonas pinastri]|uniref:NADP-dependent 3-hydroxy acid dehydrogenase YdfG n=1 Tax=Faunimonas pinastri TaxID=1855383 RepID=A0A1H9NLK6_9HYPH|nr:oxidoreductase [Faunimonas pinastri]SER36904.1 NADP-dependent 3-hydroxy acid dehydrogenase YdfG [Faunimonas pinastri]
MSNDNQAPVWFITGCSTGFGRELARLVLERGWKAVVTARDASKVQDLTEGHEGNARAIALDVTDPAQIKKAVSEAEQAFGGIDVLVNNAGYGYMAAVEEGEEDEIRAMFETNFFGLAATIRAVLPGMRKRKRGTIVNISSVGGLVGFPGSGYYAATKFAVEGLSDSLSKELAPLGLKVLVVEPGPFRTDWAGRSLKQSKTFIDDYEQTSGSRRKQTAGYSGQQPGDPVRAAEAMIKAVEAENPPLHLVLGKPGLENVRKKLDALINDIDTWEETTLGADFPDAQ